MGDDPDAVICLLPRKSLVPFWCLVLLRCAWKKLEIFRGLSYDTVTSIMWL